jgi:hypothetical protein
VTVSREDEGLQSRESFRSVFQKGYVGVTVEITVETREQGVAACSVHGAVRTVTFKLRIPTPETAMISQQQAAQRVTCSAGERGRGIRIRKNTIETLALSGQSEQKV